MGDGNLKVKKRIVAWTLILSIFVSGSSSLAISINSLEKQKEKISDKYKEKEQTKNKLGADKDKLYNEIAVLENKIKKEEKKYDVLEDEIAKLSKDIKVSNQEISSLEGKLKKQEENFRKRLRVFYMNSQMGYIELLLSAVDVNDFITRSSLIQSVADYDKRIITELISSKQLIKAKEIELKGKKKATEIVANEQEEVLRGLVAKSKEKNELLANINESLIASNEDLEALKSEMDSIDEKINAEKKRIAQQKLEAARQARAIANARARQKALVGGGVAENSNTSKTEGRYTWPVPSSHRITEYFGWRSHPMTGRMHRHIGLDIGASTGTTIVAADSGRVIYSGWDGNYGNVVRIQHPDGYTTAYAHASAIFVSVGQSVTRGEKIAAVGSTGLSTGPHLHFEVRTGREPLNPLNFVN